jgi:hypothetical protein
MIFLRGSFTRADRLKETKNEASGRLVGLADHWLLSWKQWKRECSNSLPARWSSSQLHRSTQRHRRATPYFSQNTTIN